MKLYGLQKTTLLDYPGMVAAAFFTGGCNFRCPFCHNKDLVLCPEQGEEISEEEVFNFLKKRKNVLEGVCITGGEPTLQPDLGEFIRRIKELGYRVKLDTNGYRPEVIKELLALDLLDYIAMDVKAGFSNYARVCGLASVNVDKLKKTIELVENSGISYEFRTTVVGNLHSEADFYEIRELLSEASPYYLQAFEDSGNILQAGMKSCEQEELETYLSIVKKKLPQAKLRGR